MWSFCDVLRAALGANWTLMMTSISEYSPVEAELVRAPGGWSWVMLLSQVIVITFDGSPLRSGVVGRDSRSPRPS